MGPGAGCWVPGQAKATGHLHEAAGCGALMPGQGTCATIYRYEISSTTKSRNDARSWRGTAKLCLVWPGRDVTGLARVVLIYVMKDGAAVFSVPSPAFPRVRTYDSVASFDKTPMFPSSGFWHFWDRLSLLRFLAVFPCLRVRPCVRPCVIPYQALRKCPCGHAFRSSIPRLEQMPRTASDATTEPAWRRRGAASARVFASQSKWRM